MSEPEEQTAQVHLPLEMTGGVWANMASVTHSPYEFTLNFIRLDFSQSPPTGIVVARVNMSPLLVSQLIEALDVNWRSYAEKAMPREVYRDVRFEDRPPTDPHAADDDAGPTVDQ